MTRRPFVGVVAAKNRRTPSLQYVAGDDYIISSWNKIVKQPPNYNIRKAILWRRKVNRVVLFIELKGFSYQIIIVILI
jgi:hypothetical protein